MMFSNSGDVTLTMAVSSKYYVYPHNSEQFPTVSIHFVHEDYFNTLEVMNHDYKPKANMYYLYPHNSEQFPTVSNSLHGQDNLT